jgi:hypothetical protein
VNSNYSAISYAIVEIFTIILQKLQFWEMPFEVLAAKVH